MLKRSHSDTRTVECIALLESNLKNITSPFSRKLSSSYMKFTPKEILVANLIKEGKTTKEMAELLTITPASIDTHRNSIRNKLGLNDKKISLRTYLLSSL
jgi:DNA-binding NarL/FixJ family response regulator